MKKLIRWHGLTVFLTIATFLAILWFFFVDGLIERTIEKTGSRIVGARVDLDAADLSFFPAGLTLAGLQVTDPDKPMTNAVDIERIVLSLDPLNLLHRKVIIEEMSLEGVRFGAVRKASGAIARRPAADRNVMKGPAHKKPELKLPVFQAPDVREILEKEELQSLKLIESLSIDILTERKNWRKRLEDLPGEAKFDQYNRRLEKLGSSKKDSLATILGGAGEFKSVVEDISRDLDTIRKTRKEFDDAWLSLTKRVDQARKAPLEDARRLKAKYGFSARGVEKMSQILFGPKVSETVHKAIAWYERLRPFLERAGEARGGEKGKGRPEVVKPIGARSVDVRFKEHTPLPDFLISLANASLRLRAGDIKGKIENITPDQDILGIPTTFAFSGDNLKGLKSVELKGKLNHIDPSKSKDAANLQVRGYRVEGLALSENEELPIVLERALADLKLRASLSGDAINANLLGDFHSVRISSPPGKNVSSIASSVSRLLSGINKLGLKIVVSGTLEDYDLRLSSDLDRVLKNAISKQVKEATDRLEGELETAIAEKVRGPLGEVNMSLRVVDDISAELSRRIQEGTALFDSAKGNASGGLKSLF